MRMFFAIIPNRSGPIGHTTRCTSVLSCTAKSNCEGILRGFGHGRKNLLALFTSVPRMAWPALAISAASRWHGLTA